MNKFEIFITEWIVENRDITLDEIDINANVFAADYLDSLSVFGMIMDIEDDFKIKFTPDELISDAASTIHGLAELAHSKTE